MDSDGDTQEIDIDEIATKLTGRTLKVYWFLLKNSNGVRLRDIQKNTGLSTPSLASYHLDKLSGMNLIETDSHGLFYTKRNVRVGILQFFIGQGRLMVPRYFFYVVFYLVTLIGFMFLFPFTFGPLSILLTVVLVFGLATSIAETYKAWRIKI
ncbi:MAG: hypothetical protein P1Q69_03605 [Candidatus Thorarchaeota archaeon]|nr:hypothetical protein [Candidatus Thorarchaeota archaeon]